MNNEGIIIISALGICTGHRHKESRDPQLADLLSGGILYSCQQETRRNSFDTYKRIHAICRFSEGGFCIWSYYRDGRSINCLPAEEWKSMDRPEEDIIREGILGDISYGRYIFDIINPVLFKHPISIPGALNFWPVNLTAELEREFWKNYQRPII